MSYIYAQQYMKASLTKESLRTTKDLLRMTKPILCNELFMFCSVVNINRNVNNQHATQRIDLIVSSNSSSWKSFHDVTQQHKACLSIEIPGLEVLNAQQYVNRRIGFLKIEFLHKLVFLSLIIGKEGCQYFQILQE